MAKAILASIMAKVWPIQVLGPHPKGKNANWSFDAFETPSENLSGLNSSASSPQSSGSWWMSNVGSTTSLQLEGRYLLSWFPCEHVDIEQSLVDITLVLHKESWLPAVELYTLSIQWINYIFVAFRILEKTRRHFLE